MQEIVDFCFAGDLCYGFTLNGEGLLALMILIAGDECCRCIFVTGAFFRIRNHRERYNNLLENMGKRYLSWCWQQNIAIVLHSKYIFATADSMRRVLSVYRRQG